MHLDDVRAEEEPGEGEREAGDDHPAAEAGERLEADDADAVDDLLPRERRQVPGRQDGHVVPAPGEAFGEADRVNGQSGPVRPVVGEDGEDPDGAPRVRGG